jgi:hypothetical protein
VKKKVKKSKKNPIQEAVDFGIDVTLNYENLRLTPTQRIEKKLNMLEIVKELRKAGAKKPLKS